MSLLQFLHTGNQKCIPRSLSWIINSQKQEIVFPVCQTSVAQLIDFSPEGVTPSFMRWWESFCYDSAQVWQPECSFAAQMWREDLKLPLNRTLLCFTIVLYSSASGHCRAVLVLFDGPALALHVPFQAASLVAQLLCSGTSPYVSCRFGEGNDESLLHLAYFTGQSWHKLLPTHVLW